MVPDKRIRPKRTIMVVLAFVGSLILGIFTAFFAEYIERVKSRSAGGQRVC
jgi:uncharacterized protein involved in exopolysaccharide biosynthesis